MLMPRIKIRMAKRSPKKAAMPFRERVPYSAIVERPKLKLPGNARVAVWTIVNVEEWGIERPMPRTVLPPPYGQPLLPDLPNWAWHEYGTRSRKGIAVFFGDFFAIRVLILGINIAGCPNCLILRSISRAWRRGLRTGHCCASGS